MDEKSLIMEIRPILVSSTTPLSAVEINHEFKQLQGYDIKVPAVYGSLEAFLLKHKEVAKSFISNRTVLFEGVSNNPKTNKVKNLIKNQKKSNTHNLLTQKDSLLASKSQKIIHIRKNFQGPQNFSRSKSTYVKTVASKQILEFNEVKPAQKMIIVLKRMNKEIVSLKYSDELVKLINMAGQQDDTFEDMFLNEDYSDEFFDQEQGLKGEKNNDVENIDMEYYRRVIESSEVITMDNNPAVKDLFYFPIDTDEKLVKPGSVDESFKLFMKGCLERAQIIKNSADNHELVKEISHMNITKDDILELNFEDISKNVNNLLSDHKELLVGVLYDIYLEKFNNYMFPTNFSTSDVLEFFKNPKFKDIDVFPDKDGNLMISLKK